MVGGRDDGRATLWVALVTAVVVVLAVAVPLWLRGDGTDADQSGGGRHQGGDCTGTLRATTVHGDLHVPPGETCRLLGIEVRGRTTVGEGATLYARSSYFLGGLHARGHRRVTIEAGDVRGRSDFWGATFQETVRAVIEDGRHVILRAGAYTDYVVRDNTGRVEIRDIYFDGGGADCRGNTREPVVRNISAETPGVLQGQCAGLGNFGETDF